jgi:lipopolysaccharide biosynthesis protein
MSPGGASTFPAGGRRLVIYAAREIDGALPESSLPALRALRPHSAHTLVVVDGVLGADGARALDGLAEEVVPAPGAGTAARAHRAGLTRVGGAIAGFDEVLLTGDGWVGPTGDLGPLFARMDGTGADLWGLADDGAGGLAAASRWLAVRRAALGSEPWARYGRAPGEEDLAASLARRGFRTAPAYPAVGPGSAARQAMALLAAGCPVVSREVFDGDPLVRERFDPTGRQVLRALAETGYPVDALQRDLVRTVAPRTLSANTAALEVLPAGEAPRADTGPRILVVVHVVRLDGLDDLFRRVAWVPGAPRVVATLAEPGDEDAVRAAWEASGVGTGATLETRAAAGRTGADTAAVFAVCGDLLGTHDLVIALHTGELPGGSRNLRRYVRRHTVENLLGGPRAVAALLDLFARDPALGVVFPPTPHIGTSWLGNGWRGLRDRAETVMAELGIRVPADATSPLAPYGGMWVGRPAALRALAARDWPAADRDLIDIHMRLHAYAAGAAGFRTSAVVVAAHAAIGQTSLEYTLDQLSAALFGRTVSPTRLLTRVRTPLAALTLRDAVRAHRDARRRRAPGRAS